MAYITVTQFSGKWGVHPHTVQRALGEGRVPGAVKQGGKWRIPEDAVIREDGGEPVEVAETPAAPPPVLTTERIVLDGLGPVLVDDELNGLLLAVAKRRLSRELDQDEPESEDDGGDAELAARELELGEREERLAAREQELQEREDAEPSTPVDDEREAALDEREAKLEARERAVVAREAKAAAAVPTARELSDVKGKNAALLDYMKQINFAVEKWRSARGNEREMMANRVVTIVGKAHGGAFGMRTDRDGNYVPAPGVENLAEGA